MRLFKEIYINKEFRSKRDLTKAKWGFYIPGVNSGAYDPTLHISTVIRQYKSLF